MATTTRLELDERLSSLQLAQPHMLYLHQHNQRYSEPASPARDSYARIFKCSLLACLLASEASKKGTATASCLTGDNFTETCAISGHALLATTFDAPFQALCTCRPDVSSWLHGRRSDSAGFPPRARGLWRLDVKDTESSLETDRTNISNSLCSGFEPYTMSVAHV